MKNYFILVISLMIASSSAFAKPSRIVTNVTIDHQQVTLVNQTTRNGERILIVSDQKCQNNDVCYKGEVIEGVIRIYQTDDKTRYTQFYSMQNRRLEWTMMLMQEWQDDGRVDLYIDRISDHHASAWVAYQPYDCSIKNRYDIPDFELSYVEDLLDTSIHSINDIVGDRFEAEEIFEGLNVAVVTEQALANQMDEDMSSLTLASIATGVTVYTMGRGVANTIYGYARTKHRFTNTLGRLKNMFVNNQSNSQHKILKRARIASELGFDFMSAGMFNIEKSRSNCYTSSQKILDHLL